MKQLPNTGTRLKHAKQYAISVTLVCIALLVFEIFTSISGDKFEQIKWILTFWASGCGLGLGVYTASENAAKQSYASLNRNA